MAGALRPLRRLLRLLPLTGAAALIATAAVPQEGGGIVLTFGIEQRVSWVDNPDLAIPSEGGRLRADTQLSFGFLSETARDRLSFNASTLLRGEDEGSGFEFGLDSPSANLAYVRSGAVSSFTASAFLRETDLSDGLTLSDEDETPVLLLEDGTAITKGVRLGYSFGDGAPFGGALRAGLTDTDYRDTTDPDLENNRTLNVGAGLRFTLNEVTEATLDLDHRRYDEEGAAPPEESTTLTAGLSRALPRGSLRGSLSATSDEDGNRSTLSFGRSYDLPRGSLSVDLGLTRAEDGVDPTGALAYRQDLPRGAITARLSRAVTNDADNDETLVTALSLGLTQELTPRLGLNMSANFNRSEESGIGSTTDNTSLDATLSYTLTQDWNVNLGATHRLRDEDGVGSASSSSVFLSVGRTFEFRP